MHLCLAVLVGECLFVSVLAIGLYETLCGVSFFRT